MSISDIGIVKRNIRWADKSAVEQLSHFGVATVHEALGRLGLMKPYMRPIYTGANVCGTAVTVLLQPGDNWMMHVAAEQIQPGNVVVAELSAMPFPVFSKSISAKGTIKASLGSVNIPVVCAGARVNPGDVVIGDDDGVVIVPAAIAQQAADAAESRETSEVTKRAKLAAGVLGLDIYKMRDALEEAGLKYLD